MKRRLKERLWGCQPKAAPCKSWRRKPSWWPDEAGRSISVEALLGPDGAYIIMWKRPGEAYHFHDLAWGCWWSWNSGQVYVVARGDVLHAWGWMPLRDPKILKRARKLLGLEIECIGGLDTAKAPLGQMTRAGRKSGFL